MNNSLMKEMNEKQEKTDRKETDKMLKTLMGQVKEFKPIPSRHLFV